jgi:CNT family concentrative nucleoside transporter
VVYRFVSFLGLLVMLGIAWALSENRRKFPLRVVLWGLGLQLGLGAIFLLCDPVREAIFSLVDFAVREVLEKSSDHGAAFLFGKLTTDKSLGAYVAFGALPVIIFVSAISTILYHYGVIQVVVRGMARLMQWTMRISGAEALAAALLVFFGIEGTTAIGEYIKRMTRSELFTLMAAFMATIAGSMLVVYAGTFGAPAGHLITASLMSAPAAILIAKIMVPETAEPVTAGKVDFTPPRETANLIDAAARGSVQGMKLALNIAAMLIAFVGLIFLVNLALENIFGVKLEQIMGVVFYPFAWLMGVPTDDLYEVGQLLGTKTVINEFLAYSQLKDMVDGGKIGERARTIATYALCGFANPGSIAILVGGLGGIDPDRRGELARLGWRSLVAGTLAAFTTACVAGMLIA